MLASSHAGQIDVRDDGGRVDSADALTAPPKRDRDDGGSSLSSQIGADVPEVNGAIGQRPFGVSLNDLNGHDGGPRHLQPQRRFHEPDGDLLRDLIACASYRNRLGDGLRNLIDQTLRSDNFNRWRIDGPLP